MNTVSISKTIEKATGLKKSEKQKDYVRDSGNGNIAYRLQRVDRWRNGDFHIVKYYQNSYDLYLDNVDAAKKGDDVVKVLEDLGCTNIIPHIDRKWIRFDIPTEEKIMNGYERNADSINIIFDKINSRTIKSDANIPLPSDEQYRQQIQRENIEYYEHKYENSKKIMLNLLEYVYEMSDTSNITDERVINAENFVDEDL